MLLGWLGLALGSSASHAGEIVGWGSDGAGILSNRPSGTNFVSVIARVQTGYALRTNGTIAVWGNNANGLIANAPRGSSFIAIAAGQEFALGLRANGSIVAWGNDNYRQVSNAPTDLGFIAIAAGWAHAYALRADGSIVAWGGDFENQVSATPTEAGFTAIACGGANGYALRADGSIAVWGSNLRGQISNAPTSGGFTAIAAGAEHGSALRADGSIATWGSNQLQQVSGSPSGTGFTFVAAGELHGCAIRANGSLAAWGYPTSEVVRHTPTDLGYTAVSGAGETGLALRGISNDECSGAFRVAEGWNGPFSNTTATTSQPIWACANVTRDLWFRTTTLCTGFLTIDTCDPSTTFDTALQLFTGTCGVLVPIACNDDACGTRSRLTLPVTRGTTYLLRVGGSQDQSGSFALSIECSSTTPNDECANALPLELGVNGPYSTTTATVSAETFGCGQQNSADVWFRYTARGCGDLAFETCTPARSFDTVLEVFGGTCISLLRIACNDDSCGSGSRVVVPSAVPGTTYLVHVGGKHGTTGSFELLVTEGSGTSGVAVLQTGCGGLGLQMFGSLPEIGRSIGFQLTGSSGLPSILLGYVPLNLPLCATCTLGATIDAALVGTALPLAPIPCDPLLVGGQIYVQGMDVGSSGGCALPLPFRLSSTYRITIG
ncbi:MAG: hypothetical protein IPN34_15065 [Planctomycetes bacterium]|nr:hypothetical protein [Planctomycetota bacterium]